MMEVILANICTHPLGDIVIHLLSIICDFSCDLGNENQLVPKNKQIKTRYLGVDSSFFHTHQKTRQKEILTFKLGSSFPDKALKNVDFPDPGDPRTSVILK